MSLRKELQDRWTTTHDTFTRWQAKADELVNELRDLETAIAALTRAPDFVAEKETAREQLEREPEIPEGWIKLQPFFTPRPAGDLVVEGMFEDGSTELNTFAIWNRQAPTERGLLIAYRIIEALPAPDPDEQDDASEFAESDDAQVVAYLNDIANGKPLDADLAQILHDNMDKLLITDEAPALNEAMQDEREEPVALAQPEWNEREAHIQAVEAERYAQPTNPEADFWSRGLASEQKPERKFDPFAMFKREDA